MSTKKAFLAEVAQFCEEFAISEAAFSRSIVNDGKFIGRLKSKATADLTTETLDKARAFMAAEREKRLAAAREIVATADRSRRKAA